MLRARADRCIGWHCLTPAEKFGIIFSVVVVTIVLAIAWMYYMGRAARSHRNRHSQSLPGGRWAPRNPSLPPNVALGQLPVAQQWPGHPPQVFYQPVIYNLEPQQDPRAYPYLNAGPSHQKTLGAVGQGQLVSPAMQIQPQFISPQLPPPNNNPTPSHPPMMQNGHPYCPREEEPRSFRESETERRPLTWRQKLNRIFRLPVGRASTIASSETPRRSTSHSTRASPRARNTVPRQRGGNVHSNPVMRLESPIRPEPPEPQRSHESRGEPDNDDVQSMDTNVATVHSDDYDWPVQQTSNTSARASRSRTQETPLPAHSCQVAVKPDHDSSRGDATHTREGLDTIPSVSSVSLEGASSGVGAMPTPTSRLGRRVQGLEGPRAPRESDLGTRSSISMGRSVLNREAARVNWERR